MITPTQEAWSTANQRFLMASLAGLRAHVAQTAPPDPPGWELPTPPALDRLAHGFGLSPFERSVVLLCAGVELDASFAEALGAAQANPRRAFPTFGLALASLPGAHWSAVTPGAPLRRWRLVELRDGESVTAAPLRLDERVLHFLTGVSQIDPRLRGLVHHVRPPAALPPSFQALARRLSGLWSGGSDESRFPLVQLSGGDAAGRRAVAAAACRAMGMELYAMDAADIPPATADRDTLATVWDRETVLGPAALLVQCDDEESAPSARAALALAKHLFGLVVLGAGEPLAGAPEAVLRLDLRRPAGQERLALWRQALGPAAASLDGAVEAVAAQFDVGLDAIAAVSAVVAERLAAAAPEPATVLWEACRLQSRPRLEALAQRIEDGPAWDDLVLPEPQLEVLREIAVHVRHRVAVYETWGFGAKGTRGLGISALFAGPSGTGKTMAAEVLAGDLRLDLFRIDLSQVVSKYIGETEKNLRRVFDAAEEGGAILLFDEADALFGKRSEVKDSHDRYANIEVSYLLQRMESYRGLAILTTNLKGALDTAFLRRLRFMVPFPFPDESQRAEIWRRVFPDQLPRDGVDPLRLAKLQVAGGNIRNIALNAAFLAADEHVPVRMSHLLRAARREYAKLEKPLTQAEVGGWT